MLIKYLDLLQSLYSNSDLLKLLSIDYNFHQIAPNLAGNAFSMLENDPCLHPHCMVCKEFGIIFLFMMSFY